MGPICPECQAGKHDNCDGVGNIAIDNSPMACLCSEVFHPRQRAIVNEFGAPIWDSIEGVMTYVGVPDMLKETRFHIPEPEPIPGTPPEEDPGIRAESFPELEGEGAYKRRLRPDITVIRNLSDVEVQNASGDWVPMVPWPVWMFGPVKQCLCGKYRLGTTRYQEHYAYAHILGMQD